MSSIIKSVAVVERRPEVEFLPDQSWSPMMGEAILKRGVLGGLPPVNHRPLLSKDALLEELKRLRVDIADAQKELMEAKLDADEVRAEVAALTEQREALERMDGLTPDEQAKELIREAEQRAQEIVEIAHREAAEAADSLKAQGYLDGLEQGASEARESFRAAHEPEIAKLAKLVEMLSGIREELVELHEKELVAMVATIAERIIGRTIKEDPAVLLDMLREVMREHHRETFVKVTISQDLMPAEAKAGDAICKKLIAMGQSVDVIIDTQTDPGTVLVETPGGFTDLSLPTQLDNFRATMLEE